jgi:hypothetical protein
MFCVGCFGAISDQELRRSLYRPGHAAEKFWAAVEFLSQHGDERATCHRDFINTRRKKGLEL